MAQSTISFKPHDLVRFDAVSLKGQDLPDWGVRAMESVPVAVIRRAQIKDGLFPIGIRGIERHQRWGCWLTPHAVEMLWSPEELISKIEGLPSDRLQMIPAFQALIELVKRFEGSNWIWGPTGSVGFELATGLTTATLSSDLDLIIRCDRPVSRNAAAPLRAKIHDLGVRCDILLETPVGAIALQEFINAMGPIAVRTVTGPVLMNNPWLGG